MALNLNDFRRTEITISYSKLYGILGKRYLFDVNGDQISKFWDMTPPWMQEQMQQIASRRPHVSETTTKHFYDPQTGELVATALVERYINLTLGDLVDLNAELQPNQQMFIDGETGESITYEELQAQSNHLARHLIDLGSKRKDAIAVIMHNCPQMPIAKTAAMKSGAVIVNMNPHESEDAMAQLLKQLDISTVILRPGRHGKENVIEKLYAICPELATAEPGNLHAARLPRLRRVIVAGSEKNYPGTLKMSALMKEPPACTQMQLAERTHSLTFRDTATIIHTSGTTGLSKGALLTHGMVIENAAEHVRILGVRDDDILLLPVPMFHALGIVGAYCTTLLSGATMVALEKPTPEKIVNQLTQQRCTILMSVPSLCHAVCDLIQERGVQPKDLALRLCALAGAPCTQTLIEKMNSALGVNDIIVMYGMTEASPGISSTRTSDPMEVKAKTVGRPWRGTEVRLDNTYIADNGEEEGEICIRGYNVFKGYYGNAEATMRTVDCNGWLHTGDLGQITPEGNLVISGRLKDIIICKGENISPKEVECVLEENPAIAQAIAVGAEDEVSGEVVVAFVQLEPHQQATEEQLQEFCKGKLSGLKIPKHIVIVDDYPKSETGKILRRELRKMADKIHN